jgi:hypothetical protein
MTWDLKRDQIFCISRRLFSDDHNVLYQIVRTLLFHPNTELLISPFFFLTGTKLATHSEYLKGMIIWASKIFLTSFSIMGNNIGFICLNFCLNGLDSSFNGILCSMILVSYVLRSSYVQENTSANSFNISTYSTLFSLDKLLEFFELQVILKHLPMLDIVRYRGPIFHLYIILEFWWKWDSEMACLKQPKNHPWYSPLLE